jgi:FAD/FMN-containing dehydrogenase
MRRSLFHLASLLITLAAAYNNTTQSTCNTLFSTLPDDVFYPESDTYNASIASYPFIQLRLHPTCLIQPRNAQDVSTAIKILKQNRHTKFAVRGGGHNANPGFNNIEDGVTIDMRHMNSVEVFRNIVRVGGGAIWQDVYDALDPHNITVLGGRIGVVGVAGFLTGGTYAYYLVATSSLNTQPDLN